MQATRAALFRSLTYKIHPPLLDQRSATSLLQALSKSFQTHLDRYPTAKERSGQHFKYLLSHPTFNPPAPSAIDESLHIAAFGVFQRAIAQGHLNPLVVHSCLAILSKPMTGDSPNSLGLKFITLLRSTDENLFRRLLKDPTFRFKLMQLLSKENRHDVTRKLIIEFKRRALLTSYIQVCILVEGIDQAMRMSNQLVSELMPTMYAAKYNTYHGFLPILVHLLSNPHNAAGVPTPVYDLFMERILAIAKVSGKSQYEEVFYATLAICKPNKPNPTPALNFFMSLAEHPNSAELWDDRVIKRLSLYLILKLSDTLIKQERIQDATWAMSFAQSTFPAELGLDIERHVKQERSDSSERNQAILGRLEGLLST
jgi:hypothetical protein